MSNEAEYLLDSKMKKIVFYRRKVLTGIGAGIGIGLATSKAVEAIARQPEAESKISKALLLGCALAEATAIYGFVIGLLIIIMLG